MHKHPRFLDLLHAGAVPAGAVDDYIADWHDGTDPVSLHVFLGMTWHEYARWGATGRFPRESEHHLVPQTDLVNVWQRFGPDEDLEYVPLRVHGPVRCRPACPVHWPSEHPLVRADHGWDQWLGIMTRVCRHGVEHPDPDDQQVRLHPELAEHTCDGCCAPTIDGDSFYEQDERVAELMQKFAGADIKGITRRTA